MLNEGQKSFFAEIKKGNNALLTGEAGTGKSYCIKVLVDALNKNDVAYGLTASTGVAALNIGGSTLHSWCGIGLGDDTAQALAGRVYKMKSLRERIFDTDVLVVDEISMISGDLLDKIDFIFKRVRRNSQPFGGIQMIFCGDFLQLPVVSPGAPCVFAFESKAWKDAKVQKIELTEQVRQRTDEELGVMLGKIRKGDSEAAKPLLSNNTVFPDDGIEPIVLYCLNRFVDRHNEEKLAQLEGPVSKFHATKTGDAKDYESLVKSCPAPVTLSLKKGAQVVLLHNLDVACGLVNGSLGVVLEIKKDSVRVKFESGVQELVYHKWELKKQSIVSGKTKFRVAASLSQIPLKLAYSATIHRSQGLTLSRVILDAKGAFEDGMLYVGLSRVERRENLIVKNLDISRISANSRALKFYGVESNDNPFD